MIGISPTTEAVRWRAVATRDSSFDGTFVYCVKTTRIYCRPVCKARLARRSNVEFHDTAEDAESDGYRACKRCQPQSYYSPQPEVEKIRRICKLLDDLPSHAPLPGLKAMAVMAGLSTYHFHRQFKRVTGMTPRDYALAARTVSVSSSVKATLPASFDPTPNQNEKYTQSLATWEFDSAESIPSPTERLSCKYSVINTTYSLLLVVFHQQQLYKLELCADRVDVTDSLERIFPPETYSHDCLDFDDDESTALYRQQIDTVVEALERPSGKTLEIALSVAY